jgi:formate-dependent nitrite reductase membrane component NrfD
MKGRRRYLDESLASLRGEAAQQRVEEDEAQGHPGADDVWYEVPSASRRGGTYYDRPVVKGPVWIWAVPVYFYAGGVAGAASVLAEFTETTGDREATGLVKMARRTAAAGGAIGTACLVYDLGRPERFLNMLRVFRPSSPMNVGSWILAAAAPSFAVSAILPRAGGVSGRVGNAVGKGSALLGLALSGYTGVLLANTTVPLWQASRRTLPPLFAASAASSAAALLQLLPLNDTEGRIVARFGLLGEIAELLLGTALERDAGRVAQVVRPLEEGLSSSLWRASKAFNFSGLALSLLPGSSSLKRMLSGLLGTGGGLLLRFALFEAGKASARDPRATFEQQRAPGAPQAV